MRRRPDSALGEAADLLPFCYPKSRPVPGRVKALASLHHFGWPYADWIWSPVAQHRERPGHNQHEVIIGVVEVEKWAQVIDRPTAHRYRQRQHPRRTAKAYRWVVNDAPTVCVNLDCAPFF